MGIDGHGPGHHRGITGFIVIGADGKVVWTEQAEVRLAGTLSKRELVALISELRGEHRLRAFDRLQSIGAGSLETAFPGLLCTEEPIGLKAARDERLGAVKFLESTN